MCDDHGHVHVPAVEAVPRDADWPGEMLPLEPVDSVSVLTVCDKRSSPTWPGKGCSCSRGADTPA